jgi:hypothetical protein
VDHFYIFERDLVSDSVRESDQSRYAAAARVLLQTLTSPEAVEVTRAKGMTPAP